MKCFIVYTVTFAILMVHFTVCRAQEKNQATFYSGGLRGHYGFIIPHSKRIEQVSHYNPAGIEINLSRLDTSLESRQVFNTYRITGIRASYFNFGNPDILGSAYLLTAYSEPVIFHGRRFSFLAGAGIGLSYHTRTYDTIENPANKFFATRISFPIYMNAGINLKITSTTVFSLSASYNHISNGGIKQPNLGMNFPTLSAGLQYYPSHFPELQKKHEKAKERQPGVSVSVQVLSAYRVVDATAEYPEKGTFAFGFHARVARQLTGSYSLNAGGEIIFDEAIREIIKREGKSTDYKRIALTAGQEFTFGKAAFSQYFGFYVYSPYKAFRSVYQKYDLSYRIGNMFSAGAFLKAHLYMAELLGLQINIILK